MCSQLERYIRWLGPSLPCTLGCLFAEEVGEALLSRLSPGAKIHTNALDQESLVDLYLTLLHTRMGAKSSRGKLCHGLCDLFRACLRRVLAWCATPNLLIAPITSVKSATFTGFVPLGFCFTAAIRDTVDAGGLFQVPCKSLLLLFANL